MTGLEVLTVGQEAVRTLIKVAGPILAVGLGIGVLIAMFQTLTSINEMTLTFVPKIFAVFSMVLYSLPHIGQTLSDFMDVIADRIVSGGG